MSFINIILRHFIKTDNIIIIGSLSRNDICYCDSNLKFKKCHEPELQKKGMTAYIVEDIATKEKSIKIMKTLTKSSSRIKSNLTWEDIGGGRIGKIDP